jgi:hypothetical protein
MVFFFIAKCRTNSALGGPRVRTCRKNFCQNRNLSIFSDLDGRTQSESHHIDVSCSTSFLIQLIFITEI